MVMGWPATKEASEIRSQGLGVMPSTNPTAGACVRREARQPAKTSPPPTPRHQSLQPSPSPRICILPGPFINVPKPLPEPSCSFPVAKSVAETRRSATRRLAACCVAVPCRVAVHHDCIQCFPHLGRCVAYAVEAHLDMGHPLQQQR